MCHDMSGLFLRAAGVITKKEELRDVLIHVSSGTLFAVLSCVPGSGPMTIA